MARRWISRLFIVAGIYDGVLGFVFLLFYAEVFVFFDVEPPNHPAYVQFPALLLIVFAIMFFRVASNPSKHRELMLYGVGLKAAYSGTAFWYALTLGIPAMWIPWAWADLCFLILFLVCWKMTAPEERSV